MGQKLFFFCTRTHRGSWISTVMLIDVEVFQLRGLGNIYAVKTLEIIYSFFVVDEIPLLLFGL